MRAPVAPFSRVETQLQPCEAFLHCFQARKNWKKIEKNWLAQYLSSRIVGLLNKSNPTTDYGLLI